MAGFGRQIFICGCWWIVVMVYCEMVVFDTSSKRCLWPDASSYNDGGESGVKVALVSDVHILGKRRRTWIERVWVDWQLRKSFRPIIKYLQPDLVLVLGDLFDEGGRASGEDWDEYAARYKAALSIPPAVDIIQVMGNHDSEFGYRISRSMVDRFESTFGRVNSAMTLHGHTFVVINSMVVDGARDRSLTEDTLRFVSELGEEREQLGSAAPPVVLLSHFPLYRSDDTNCGEERGMEGGHVTYDAPHTPLREGWDCISHRSSDWLLRTLRPALVLTGHTHTVCRTEHVISTEEDGRGGGGGKAAAAAAAKSRTDTEAAVIGATQIETETISAAAAGVNRQLGGVGMSTGGGEGGGKGSIRGGGSGGTGRRQVVREFTTPTFSWGMRPDPSFGLARLQGADTPPISLCPLPDERWIGKIYISTLAVSIVWFGAPGWWCWWGTRISKTIIRSNGSGSGSGSGSGGGSSRLRQLFERRGVGRAGGYYKRRNKDGAMAMKSA